MVNPKIGAPAVEATLRLSRAARCCARSMIHTLALSSATHYIQHDMLAELERGHADTATSRWELAADLVMRTTCGAEPQDWGARRGINH